MKKTKLCRSVGRISSSRNNEWKSPWTRTCLEDSMNRKGTKASATERKEKSGRKLLLKGSQRPDCIGKSYSTVFPPRVPSEAILGSFDYWSQFFSLPCNRVIHLHTYPWPQSLAVPSLPCVECIWSHIWLALANGMLANVTQMEPYMSSHGWSWLLEHPWLPFEEKALGSHCPFKPEPQNKIHGAHQTPSWSWQQSPQLACEQEKWVLTLVNYCLFSSCIEARAD